LNEFDLIERYFVRPVSRNDVTIGIGDDTAVCAVPGGHELLLTTDLLVAGVHFPEDAPAAAVGHKALAVNLSDLAAMGADPAWFTLTLSLPGIDEKWLQEFSQGMFALAETCNIALVGGDTVKGPLVAGIQACGLAPKGTAVLRSGARVGDKIFVTGSLGDAALGLRCIQREFEPPTESRDYFISRLHFPAPRISEGLALRNIANAMIDVSDGLVADLAHVLERSSVGATIQQEALPLSSHYRDKLTDIGFGAALTGGDDYELCFTVSADKVDELRAISRDWGCVPGCIGEIEQEPGLRIKTGDGNLIEPDVAGFDHFATH
jgi:thiamine-monophosphate kinase